MSERRRCVVFFLVALFHCFSPRTSGAGETEALNGAANAQFSFAEATIDDIHGAFAAGELTSERLTAHYLSVISLHNPLLRAVIETSPTAGKDAAAADRRDGRDFGPLHGIPVLVKDNIAIAGAMNTTAGSFALLGSSVHRDAGVVARLKNAGAVVIGKASLSEWADFRSSHAPDGWCARSGQGRNPYVLEGGSPCGSSSGSAIAAAANMVTVTLGTETDGSILCPAMFNSVVGIKPTVGLTSRAGVVPISPRQDTVGPICRTVSDAAVVLEAIVGYDPRDAEATSAASKYIPVGGYRQFLRKDGLEGKRIGILTNFFRSTDDPLQKQVFDNHFQAMRQHGAVLVGGLMLEHEQEILDAGQSGEDDALLAEFKIALNSYLTELPSSPVRSLADVIAFNNLHSAEEMIPEYGQDTFISAQETGGIGPKETAALSKMKQLNKEGLEKVMKEERLDAVAAADLGITTVLAIGGYPGITVPAGYGTDGAPFGIVFGGLRGSEPALIEIAFAFEQATRARRPPSLQLP